MPSDKRASVARFSLKSLSAAVMSALLMANANAAGLGRLTVLSALGQPLHAEIELTSVSKDEAGALVAKLASAEAFRQANLDLNAALLTLQFNIETRGERQFIRVSSAQPLNEPFVDMLLELSGPSGRLIREYTFLLDPPELRTTQAAVVAPSTIPELGTAAAQAAVPRQQQASPQPRPSSSVPASRAMPDATQGTNADYEVRQGDTLTRIATQVKPAGVSLDQMLVALYQSNPDAFMGENMNRLKAGHILSVPTAEAAAAVDPAQARSLIVAQTADFNAYRQRLAGQVASAAAQAAGEARQGASGRITARVDERPTPAGEALDRLQLSHATAAAGAPAGSVTAEDLIASEKARAEAEARINELERTVSDLQKLLELKSQELATQQQQAEAAKPETAAPAPAATAQSGQAPAAAKPAAEKPAPKPKPKPAPVKPAAPPAPSLFDELMSNPLTLPGLGLLLAALGGLGIYRMRRQKASKQFEDSIITDSSLKANSLFGSTGGQSVDTNNSVFNSNFSPSVSQLDSNEVDPVAEADVYIAYGRDAQAEEILKDALRTQPDRHAVRVKLLEIYSNRKDLRAFEVLATELYGLTRGIGDEWAQAAAMGVALDPNNPLYAGAKNAEGSSSGSAAARTGQGWETLLSETQGDTATFETGSKLEGESAYFDTTQVTEAENEAETGEDVSDESPKAASNELDFDLEGMNLALDVPNTMPRPEPAEPSAELAAIDFDFLDTKASSEEGEQAGQSEPAEQSEPVAEQLEPAQADPVPSLDDLELALKELAPQDAPTEPATPTDTATPEFTLDVAAFDLAPVETEAAAEPALSETAEDVSASATPGDAASEPNPMDFDLSGISLELDASAGEAAPDTAIDSSSASEMATKLDLAIAYQEIGDKEGARELLDEVLKGGTPEQSEKAKSLLLELA